MSNRLLLTAAPGCLALVLAGAVVGAPRKAAPPVQAMDPQSARRSVSLLAEFYREHLHITHTTYLSGSQTPAAVRTRGIFAVP